MKTTEFDCNLLKKDGFTLYAYAALKAYCIIIGKGYTTLMDYEKAWIEALDSIPNIKKSNLTKCCPRKAFLGLCEDGYLKDIEAITPTKTNKKRNKEYAIEAVNILNSRPLKSP